MADTYKSIQTAEEIREPKNGTRNRRPTITWKEYKENPAKLEVISQIDGYFIVDCLKDKYDNHEISKEQGQQWVARYKELAQSNLNNVAGFNTFRAEFVAAFFPDFVQAAPKSKRTLGDTLEELFK